MNLFRKTIFLITGTVTGVAGVLAYNPPHISSAMASGNSLPTGSTPTQSSTQSSTQTSSDQSSQQSAQQSTSTQQTPAQPQSKQTTPAKKTTPTQTNSQSSTSTTQTQTQTQTQTSSNSQTTSPTPAPVQASGKSGTFKGDVARTHYGPVQVQITVNNGKITDVQALSYPDGDGRSQYISSVMIPWLTQETLKVQSTNIMNVSGATITGNAWKYSLASAMQQAGL
jgi:uncharacterized protein with FMN-binding domain